ncbi:hypothetical protein D3C86_1735870 [compost metagenome]
MVLVIFEPLSKLITGRYIFPFVEERIAEVLLLSHQAANDVFSFDRVGNKLLWSNVIKSWMSASMIGDNVPGVFEFR